MYKDHSLFEKPKDHHIKIWRYLDFAKFVSQLDKNALYFVRSDKLSDPFEGSYSRLNLKLRPVVYKEIPEDTQKLISNVNKDIRRFTLINCWHMSEYESAAMWKLYLKSNEGVAIQSSFKLLTESFHDYVDNNIFIGKVKYIDYDTEWLPEGNTFYPFLHKRKSFEHEQEIRAIIQKLPSVGDRIDLTKNTFDLGAYIKVNFDILIEKIFIAPTAPIWFYDMVNSIVNKYGLGKEVVQSNLTGDPVF